MNRFLPIFEEQFYQKLLTPDEAYVNDNIIDILQCVDNTGKIQSHIRYLSNDYLSFINKYK